MSLTITASWTAPGYGPAGLAWNGSSLFNADYRAGYIFQIDPATGQTERQYICPGSLTGVAWGNGVLWQAFLDSGEIRRVNPENGDFDQNFFVANVGRLSGLAWDGQNLWAASQTKGQLIALDPTDGRSLRTLPAPIASGGLTFHNGRLWIAVPHLMAFDEATQEFDWLNEEEQYFLLEIDPHTGQEQSRRPLPFLPLGLAWTDSRTLWLSNPRQRQLHQAQVT